MNVAKKTGQDDSYIRKHHILHHGGEGSPKFHLRPVMFFMTALENSEDRLLKLSGLRSWGKTDY